MPLDTYMVLANQYESEKDALADYEAVRKLYADQGIIDTYDAAVLTRGRDGKVSIVKRVEQPTRRGSLRLRPGCRLPALQCLVQPPFAGFVIAAHVRQPALEQRV